MHVVVTFLDPPPPLILLFGLEQAELLHFVFCTNLVTYIAYRFILGIPLRVTYQYYELVHTGAENIVFPSLHSSTSGPL